MQVSFGHVLTAMVTPMQQDGSVDFDRAAELARRLANSGSDGIVVCGTTGESSTLTNDEKLRLFEAVMQGVDGRAKVLAGTGTNATAESVELSKAAAAIGVDGLMTIVPYYNKPTQEGLFQHFREIASATTLPVMLYNVPGRTGQNLLPETVARLVQEIPTIKAIKEASGDLAQVTEIRTLCPDLLIYSGDDALTLPILAIGGHGVVSVASHLVGERMKAMVVAYKNGQIDEAAQIHGELMPFFKMLFITTNPIPIKVAIRLSGFDVGPFRLPLCEPTEAELARIQQVMEAYGLLANRPDNSV